MRHCSASTRNCIRTVFYNVRNSNTPFVLITSPPHLLLTIRVIRHSIWLRRGYTTKASGTRNTPDYTPALPPQRRSPVRPPKFESYKKSNLELELRWLKDPVRLADHTVKLLRQDDFAKALEIVRLASKDVECTVSWNHLIDYEMSKARVSKAVKLYNEVSSCLVHYSTYVEA